MWPCQSELLKDIKFSNYQLQYSALDFIFFLALGMICLVYELDNFIFNKYCISCTMHFLEHHHRGKPQMCHLWIKSQISSSPQYV